MMEIAETIDALNNLMANDGHDTPDPILGPVVECLKRCAALHVAVSVLIDEADTGGERPDYRTDVECEHVHALRDLIAGRQLPDDPRYTSLRLQVHASVRQLNTAVEKIDGGCNATWILDIAQTLNAKLESLKGPAETMGIIDRSIIHHSLRCPTCETWKNPFMLAAKTRDSRPDVMTANYCGDCGAKLIDPE